MEARPTARDCQTESRSSAELFARIFLRRQLSPGLVAITPKSSFTPSFTFHTEFHPINSAFELGNGGPHLQSLPDPKVRECC